QFCCGSKRVSIDVYIPFYVGDYLRETLDLSTEEHGAFILLLFCFWVADGVLPDNDKAFATVAKVDLETWKTQFRPRLARFFKIEGGKWTHQRTVDERAKATRISALRSAAGRLGGRPKKQMKSKSEANAKAT